MGLKCVLLQCVTCKLAEVSSQTNMVSLNTLSHFFFFLKSSTFYLVRQMVCFTKPFGKELGESIQEKGRHF